MMYGVNYYLNLCKIQQQNLEGMNRVAICEFSWDFQNVCLSALKTALHQRLKGANAGHRLLHCLGFDMILCLPLTDPLPPWEFALLVDTKPLPRKMVTKQAARRRCAAAKHSEPVQEPFLTRSQ